MSNGLLRTTLLSSVFVALAWAALAEETGEKRDEPKKPDSAPEGKAPAAEAPNAEEPKDLPAKSDPLAVELFDKAVAWQGKPTRGCGKLIDLEIDQLEFHLWSKDEVEASMKILHTAPDKVWIEIWSKAPWYRRYWCDGTNCRRKTGTTKGDSELLDVKREEDREGISLVTEALRLLRLILLENLRTPDAVFNYLALKKPMDIPDARPCHVVERDSPKPGDLSDRIRIYLSQADYSPVCIRLSYLLTVAGEFFIHLSRFQDFQGVKFPTHIEIYQFREDGPKKFLFADVIIDADRGTRVRVNGGIDDEIYGPGD